MSLRYWMAMAMWKSPGSCVPGETRSGRAIPEAYAAPRSRREKSRGGQTAYFIGEKAAGMRILFCWLTKNSRVFGGQLGSFCDSSRIRARSARSL